MKCMTKFIYALNRTQTTSIRVLTLSVFTINYIIMYAFERQHDRGGSRLNKFRTSMNK